MIAWLELAMLCTPDRASCEMSSWLDHLKQRWHRLQMPCLAHLGSSPSQSTQSSQAASSSTTWESSWTLHSSEGLEGSSSHILPLALSKLMLSLDISSRTPRRSQTSQNIQSMSHQLLQGICSSCHLQLSCIDDTKVDWSSELTHSLKGDDLDKHLCQKKVAFLGMRTIKKITPFKVWSNSPSRQALNSFKMWCSLKTA